MATVWPIGQTPQIPTRAGVIGSSTRRVVPEEGLASDIVPPSASTRSRRPRSPDPHDGSAPPTPSSETETRTPYPDALLEGAINAPLGPEARDAPVALASFASPTGRGNLNTWLFSHLGAWPGDTQARSPCVHLDGPCQWRAQRHSRGLRRITVDQDNATAYLALDQRQTGGRADCARADDPDFISNTSTASVVCVQLRS